ncbi:alpha/beta hydrolase family protein [Actinoplanes utahensis]|uniref:Serine aminopeptidase S33 domain-containing protein n=1 Tax=Actinoplanes utahensis TaxID=1869 RepID=A0A0A6UFD2_ACTUT|nr:alpha/beta fold hydrolase [Actinoplanes utahensis]KHD74176.1 hypothetical protein MB27_30245 [Actinoplanes utahensis]GIF33653.1 hypothetical protein Aut01nite_66390 [Actinoplanes utahensis]
MRRWVAWASAVVLAVAGLGAAAAWGNTFAMEERAVSLPGLDGTLDGVLTLPEHRSGPVPVVVFVHGDGPVDATNQGLYRPQFEALAEAGVASVSWSKPGVGGSDGDWLRQDQADRAREVAGAVAALRQWPEIDPERVGLWGASQGGWVVPAAAAADPRIAFVVLVSPAVNWMRQGEFHLRASLADDGADQTTRDAALAARDRVNAVLARGGSYEEYLAAKPFGEPMNRDRWAFVGRNFRSDATAALRDLAHRQTPVLLLLGGDDRNVDAHETERVYREVLGRVRVCWFPDADHALVRSEVADYPVRAWVTAVFSPRRLMAPGYLRAMADFARDPGV